MLRFLEPTDKFITPICHFTMIITIYFVVSILNLFFSCCKNIGGPATREEYIYIITQPFFINFLFFNCFYKCIISLKTNEQLYNILFL